MKDFLIKRDQAAASRMSALGLNAPGSRLDDSKKGKKDFNKLSLKGVMS